MSVEMALFDGGVVAVGFISFDNSTIFLSHFPSNDGEGGGEGKGGQFSCRFFHDGVDDQRDHHGGSTFSNDTNTYRYK